jgi:hypothetical protein
VPKKRTRLSLVWFIPIVAAIVGAWVAVTRVLSEGPKITIVLHSAEELEAGKTKIHYNGVGTTGRRDPTAHITAMSRLSAFDLIRTSLQLGRARTSDWRS